MRTHSWIWIVPVVLPSLGAPARAAPPASNAHVQASEAFRRGREAMDKNDFDGALKLLRASQALEPGHGKLLNIAICEENLGQLVSAMSDYRKLEGKFLPGDERGSVLKEHVDALGPRIPRLHIEIPATPPPSLQVRLDNEIVPAMTLQHDIQVDPGNHTVTGAAPGCIQKRYPVTAKEGERAEIRIEIACAVTVAVPPPPEPRSLLPPLAALAVGGAGLAVGAVTGMLALARMPGLKEACGSDLHLCPESYRGELDSTRALGHVSTAGFILGGVGAAVGVTLLLWPQKRPGPKVGLHVGPEFVSLTGEW